MKVNIEQILLKGRTFCFPFWEYRGITPLLFIGALIMKMEFFLRLILSFYIGLFFITKAEYSYAESLESTLISVYNKNPILLAERERLKEVQESYIQARAQGGINVFATGILAGSITDNSSIISDSFSSNPRIAQLNIAQPLYQGGRVKHLKLQATSNIYAQTENLKAREILLFLSAAIVYAESLKAQQTYSLREKNVEVLLQQLNAAKMRFKAGEGTLTDVAQSETRLSNARANLIASKGEIEIVGARYKRLVGRLPTSLTPIPSFETPKDLTRAIAVGRRTNPELLSANHNVKASEAAIGVAQSEKRPVISLNGAVSTSRGQSNGLANSDVAELTARIRVPIYTSGLNDSSIRQAEFSKTRSAFLARDLERAVIQNVTELWTRREVAKSMLLIRQEQTNSANSALEGVKIEQNAGIRTQLDILDAQQEYLDSKLAVIDAELEFHISTFNLLANIGTFNADSLRLNLEKASSKQN